jgi:nucleoside-diphosphate-sugar epimerase
MADYPSPDVPGPGTARVALTGSTGFIGSAILRSLVPVAPTTVLRRQAPPAPGPARVVVGGLADAPALVELCSGADVLVHAASYVGDDPARQVDTNVRGTERVVAAARRAGVRRIVLLSTAGVYGGDLGAGRVEGDRAERPRSELSASRLAAEHVVLDAGGVVLRPHLVHGQGDRWFLAPLLAAVQRLGAWIGEPDAPQSCVGRARLGALAAALALDPVAPGVYHAAEERPTTVRRLVEPVLRQAGASAPEHALGGEAAAAALAPLGVTRAQVALVERGSWFSTAKLWGALSASGPRFALPDVAEPEDPAWYAAALGGQPSVTR